jgi:Ca2+/H+ antiporter, TMEM165/GDT1 family
MGAAAGVILATIPAVLLGAELQRMIPVKAIRLGSGIIFGLIGIIAAVSALKLI